MGDSPRSPGSAPEVSPPAEPTRSGFNKKACVITLVNLRTFVHARHAFQSGLRWGFSGSRLLYRPRPLDYVITKKRHQLMRNNL